MPIDIRLVGPELLREFTMPISAAFGIAMSPEREERYRRLPELDTRIAAYDGKAIVGCAGVFSFDSSTTGGRLVPTAGLTMVAVHPTHRRQGILRSLMRRHLDEARGKGQPVAALWASEASIYGRYGYGLASYAVDASVERNHSTFVGRDARAEARFVDDPEALELMPTIWERARRLAPGMPSRSPLWWSQRRLIDHDLARAGAGPLQRVVMTIDGIPEAYALYRTRFAFDEASLPAGTAIVSEAIGATPAGTRAILRYLCDLDLVTRIKLTNLPVDHPLFLLMVEPKRIHASVIDALWMRIVDVPLALAARSYDAADSIVLEIDDAFCPWNSGRYRLDAREARAHRTNEPADLWMTAAALGSAYLGGITFSRLAEIGDVQERTDDAIQRADRIFRTNRAPWCPEIF